jgi:alpha-L-rhamnosidase
MREVRGAQRPNGAFPMWAPMSRLWHSLAETPLPGWADAGVELPYTAYLHDGDRTVIDENWQAMNAYLDGVLKANPDNVWRQGRGFDLGDWLALDAVSPMDETTPKDLVATAMLARSLERVATLASWTGRSEDSERRRNQASAVRTAFAREFIDADGLVGNGSQTSYVLALSFQLVPQDLRVAAGALLAADIRSRGIVLSTGFLGTPLALDALVDAGEVDLAYSLLLRREYPSWGYMADRGATTIWERWNGDTGDVAMNSYNHYALGAVSAFLYRRVAGIQPLEPGFSRVRIAPLPDNRLTHAVGRYDSVRGVISSQWRQTETGVSYEIRIPAGVVAELELPGIAYDSELLTYDTKRQISGGTLGSGQYRFSTRSVDGAALAASARR